jgi:hypothetical protein
MAGRYGGLVMLDLIALMVGFALLIRAGVRIVEFI